jgi:2-desacetyl-2-hydroxyethyl bacteriochlorophyllide A dehydrogenase
MKALVLNPGRLRLEANRSQPSILPGECLIKVLRAGICSTDIALIKGMYGFSGVIGHEFVGEVVSGESEWLGKRVVCDINVACSQCEQCLLGLRKHCLQRKTIGIREKDGAFAEFIAVPAVNLYEVPARVSDDRAVFVEPLAAAFDVLEKADFSPEQKVLILGDGRMGQLIARVVQRTGAEIFVLGKYEEKLKRLPKEIQRFLLTDQLPHKFDIVIEATGNPSALRLALQSVKAQGSVILKSTFDGDASLDFSALVVNEVKLLGSRCGRFDVALEALNKREVEVESLIDGHFGLEDYEDAFEQLRNYPRIKMIFEIEDDF